jgi:hypothetical protein
MQYIFKKYTDGLNCEKKRYAQYKVDLFQADHANNLK